MKKSDNLAAHYRWHILILMLIIGLFLGFFLDSISPLKEELEKSLMANSYDYGFIVASASLPGLVLLTGFFGGLFLDRFGVRITVVLFGIIMTSGAFLAAYALSAGFHEKKFLYQIFNSFWRECNPSVKLMALGFFIFGLGSQVVRVSMSRIIVGWFKAREVATALTLRTASLRVGAALSLVISPILFSKFGWRIPMWLSFSLIVISFAGLIIYLLIMRQMFKDKEKPISKKKRISLKLLLKLFTNQDFIYLLLIQLLFNATLFPLITYGPDMLRNSFNFDLKQGGIYISFFIIIIAVISPFVGYYIDKNKKPERQVIVGAVLSLIAVFGLWLGLGNPIAVLAIYGIGASFFVGSIQFLIPKLVQEELLGTAFGLMNTVKNIGIWAITLLLGYVLSISNENKATDSNLNYSYALLSLIFIAVLGFVISLLIYRRSLKYPIKTNTRL